jgi:hypothetical protein
MLRQALCRLGPQLACRAATQAVEAAGVRRAVGAQLAQEVRPRAAP